MDHLPHRIAANSIISTGATFRHLVCPIFILRGFLSDYLDRVIVSTFRFVFLHLAALDTKLKYLLVIGVFTLLFFVFLINILNRSKEGSSKINIIRIAYRLHQFATLKIFWTYKIMLPAFFTECNLKNRSFFDLATPLKKNAFLWEIRHEGTLK
ncbi:hypothetical protein ES708_23083 [subsurface metagenome]